MQVSSLRPPLVRSNACLCDCPYEKTFRMTICDNPETKPCPDDVCNRDQLTLKLVDALDRVVWFIAFKPRHVMYVNPAFSKLWNISREELYANPRLWMARVHRGDRERVEQTFASWVSGIDHKDYDIEYRIVREDGCIMVVRDVISGLFDRDGTLCGSSGILSVITPGSLTGIYSNRL